MNSRIVARTHQARWAAIGAALAVAVGAGGIGVARATAPSGASAYVPLSPCRLADTRPAPDGVGPKTSPVGPGETWTLAGWGEQGSCAGPAALPADTSGLQLNVTAVGATDPTFLTLFPAGAVRPTASSLNPTPGTPPVPNAVTVSLAGDGTFSVFNRFGSVHVIIDVVGYYTDHDHDDRYYTEAEVDAALATKADASELGDKAGRARSIMIPPVAFKPTNDDASFTVSMGTGARGDQAGLVVLYAPVELPVGAAITAATFYVFDNDAGSDITVGTSTGRLATNTTSSWAQGTATSGAAAAPYAVQLTVAAPRAVTDTETLAVYASANPWSATMGVKGVRIDYLLPG